MKDKRLNLLSKSPIPKAVMTLSIPAIIGMLIMSIYNVVDTMFVAWLGTAATGATQIVYPVMMVITAIGLSYGIGTGSYISRLLGQKNQERSEQALATTLIMAAVTGVLLAIGVNTFLEPILRLFGASDTTMAMSKAYGFFIVLGAPFQVLNMSMNNMLRAEGSAINSMLGMAIGAIINIILDPIFIFVFDLGIEGAAIATTLSQFITTCILLYQYTSKKTVLRLHFKKFSLDKAYLSELLRMGTPTFSRQLLVSISIGLLNVAARQAGGDVGIASLGIVSRLMMMIQFVIFGLGQGFQVVAGYNYGAKAYPRVKSSLKFTMMISFAFSVLTCSIFLIFSGPILSIFKPTTQVLELAKQFMVGFALSTVLMSISNIVGVYYQAIGKGLPALILSVARQGIFFIPIILILPNILGINGVIYAQALADILTLGLSIMMFLPTYKKLNQIPLEKVS